MSESYEFTYNILDGRLLEFPQVVTINPCKAQDYGIVTKRIYLTDFSGTCEVDAYFIIQGGVEYGQTEVTDTIVEEINVAFRYHEDAFEGEFE